MNISNGVRGALGDLQQDLWISPTDQRSLMTPVRLDARHSPKRRLLGRETGDSSQDFGSQPFLCITAPLGNGMRLILH